MSDTQRGGMQRIPFPTESYEHPSRPLSAKRLLNCFVEEAPKDARAPFVLRTSPGLVYRETLGSGPLEAFNTELVGGFYAVSGNAAYRNSNGLTTWIGDVGTKSSGAGSASQAQVTIAVSPDMVAICVPPRLYAAAHYAASLAPVDVSGFPGGGFSSICYMNGYFVATQYGIGTAFFTSALRDPTTWDPLDFAQADSLTNVVFSAVTHRGELWLVGASAIEVWYDAGAADFPLRRREGGVITPGAVPRTVAQIDNSLWYLAQDGTVYRTQTYQVRRVSSHAVEAITEAWNPNQALAVGYMQEGHACYALTLGDAGRTLIHDAATKQWHDRSSSADGSGPWRALVAGRISEHEYVGDAAGRLYRLDPAGSLDDTVPILGRVTLPPLYAETRRAFCARCEVEMEAPPDTDVTLTWSDDGGETFGGGPRIMSGADVAGARRRLVTTRLGSFHQRVFSIETHGRVSLYAVDADISAGAH